MANKYYDDMMEQTNNLEKDYSLSLKSISTKGRKSIAGMAKENIFEFPVFISSNNNIEYATAVNELLGQLYASFIQSAISVNPIVDADMVVAGKQFAKFKADTNAYVEHVDMTYAIDSCHNKIENADFIVEFDRVALCNDVCQAVQEYCDYIPLSEFSHFFQEANMPDEDYVSSRKDPNGNITEDAPSEASRRKIDNEIDKLRAEIEQLGLTKKDIKYNDEYIKSQTDKIKAEVQKLNQDLDDPKYDDSYRKDMKLKLKAEANKAAKIARDYDEDRIMSKEKHNVDMKTKSAQMIDEPKTQKLNTMKPIMMVVNLRVKDKNSGVSEPIEYVVGVKTNIILVDADILPEVAQYPVKEMNKLSRKAKWRAGEINFLEFLFNIKGKKQTAIDAKDPKRKWYRRLYELAHVAGNDLSTNVIMGKGMLKDIRVNLNINRPANKATYGLSIDEKNANELFSGMRPNATIVITQNDVDNIKSKTDIDLLKPSNAKKFCKELFLISFVVVDYDAESLKLMIPDLHEDFEVHSIASINKQIAMLGTAGTTTNELFKLLSK